MKKFRVGIWLIFGLIVVMGFSGVPAQAAVIFSDNFNSENGGIANGSTLNYTGFTNWTVSGGTVDLIGNGYFDYYPGNGLYVDLDGSTNNAGIMTTKTGLSLGPGQYELKFWLGGNHNAGTPDDTVVVSVDVGIVSQTYTLASGDPLKEKSLLFTIGTATTANIVFDHQGGDNIGIILDQVSLSQVPEPGTLILLGSGLLGLAIAGSRKKFRK